MKTTVKSVKALWMELHQNIRSADDSRYSLIIEDKVQKITQGDYESN